MPQRFTLTIIPTGGSVTKTTASSGDLVVALDRDGTRVRTADVGGQNFDITQSEGEVRKCTGHKKWYATPAATGGTWQSYLMLDDGTNITPCGVYKGKFYKFASTGEATNVDAATPVTFDTGIPVCLMQYGAYAVMGSIGKTPYKWKYGDTNLSKLITSSGATEFKFKYLEKFHNHVIGAYSDQTNGNIDIRWTAALPSFADLSFPAANQLYKPDSDIGITGIKTVANMQCLVYGRSTIHNLVYDANAPIVFSLDPVASNVGAESHWSIVDTGRSHCFFDRNRGFVELQGGASWTVISDPILPWIQSITRTAYGAIVGVLSIGTNEVCWAIPTNGSTTPDTLIYYNLISKQWRREYRTVTAMLFADYQAFSTYTWTQLRTDSPNTPYWPTSGTWNSFRDSFVANILFGNTTGYSYWVSGNDMDGDDYDGYRIEPITSLPDSTRAKRTQEIHFGIAGSGSFSIDAYWRAGETEQDCRAAQWESIGSVSCATGESNTIYFDACGKYNQLKWGTDLKNETFRVTSIVAKGIFL